MITFPKLEKPKVVVSTLKKYSVNAPRLNIREYIAGDAPTKRALNQGDIVELMEIELDWAKIRTSDGYTGWVRFKFLTPQ